MKITAVGAGGARPEVQLSSQRSASPDKIERAKAIASGKQVGNAQVAPHPDQSLNQQQISQAPQEPRRLKVKTNYTPNYIPPNEQMAVEQAATQAQVVELEAQAMPGEMTQDPNINPIIETQESAETRPLSAQHVALAKAKRALQLKEQEIARRESEIESRSKKDLETYRARIKQDPLGVYEEEGITYDKLTEAVLSRDSDPTGQVAKALARIQALEQKLEDQVKGQATSQEKQVENYLKGEGLKAQQIIATSEEFELVRDLGGVPDALKLIKEIYSKEGVVMDTREALKLVEEDYKGETKRLLGFKAIQKMMGTAPASVQQQQTQQGMRQQVRSLSNNDGASRQLSPKERAIAAFNGTLRR